MILYAVLDYTECADLGGGGYLESLYVIFQTYEEAREFVNKTLKNYAFEYDDSHPGHSFMQIVKMQFGSTSRTVVFDSRKTLLPAAKN
jgi:hypothetical protein